MSKKQQNLQSSRREFIKKTLQATAGIYAGMTVIDNFIGPKVGKSGMPLNAATPRINSDPPSDVRPGNDGPRDVPPGHTPPGPRGDRDHPRPVPEHRRRRE